MYKSLRKSSKEPLNRFDDVRRNLSSGTRLPHAFAARVCRTHGKAAACGCRMRCGSRMPQPDTWNGSRGLQTFIYLACAHNLNIYRRKEGCRLTRLGVFRFDDGQQMSYKMKTWQQKNILPSLREKAQDIMLTTVDLVIFACLNFCEFLNLGLFTKFRISELPFFFSSAIIIIFFAHRDDKIIQRH